ncbi:MAG: LapA family protein [Sporolactobacillus sp.]
MKKQWLLLLTLLFVLLIILFSIANVDNVTFSFLIGKVRMPLILVVIGGILLGALLTGMFSYGRIYKLQRRVRALEQALENGDARSESELVQGHEESAEQSRVARRKRTR